MERFWVGSAKLRWSPSGTIRTARVRIERAAVVIARARQYRTPRQGFPPRAIVPTPGESHDKLRTILAAACEMTHSKTQTEASGFWFDRKKT